MLNYFYNIQIKNKMIIGVVGLVPLIASFNISGILSVITWALGVILLSFGTFGLGEYLK